ncbi:MAG TPA: HAD-IA family hydrolase [Methylophilaceae bacterium]|nr:HAD-IA family hydrolase [Methylophilaceae bacterium]
MQSGKVAPQLILFDLDGTLVDTAPDLGLALNLQRERYGLPPLSQEVIRPYASHGSRGLLSIGFGITPEHADFNAKRVEYLALYDEVFTRSPVLFEGVANVLAAIEAKQLPWGVVTNKPRRFTQPLLKAINLFDRAVCVISADDAPRAKPYPDTLLMACAQAGIEPSAAIYIGDAERDIQAGIAAGMPTVIALYGYLDVLDQPDSWGADYKIDNPMEMLNLI